MVVWFWALRVPSVSLPELSGSVRQATLAVQGLNRSLTFYVPRTLKPDGALVLVLHGSSMSGARMRAQTAHAFDVIADREGVIVAYRDGYRGHWNDCRAVGDYEAKHQSIDDVTFLRALVGRFVREYQIARERVFAAGVSNGGQMAFRLAYEAPDLVRAVAAIAASLPTDEDQTCKPSGRLRRW